MSRRVRSATAQVRLGEVQSALLDIARTGGIAPTLAGIAAQLNNRGLRRSRRDLHGEHLLYSTRSVAHSLAALGIERSAIERWRRLADKWAAENDVPTKHILRQLYEEWRYHHVIRAMKGQAATTAETTPFMPAFVRPEDWRSPWERDKHPFIKPLAAHNGPAKLVKAWIGTFDRDDV